MNSREGTNGGLGTVDQGSMRRQNLSVVLRALAARGRMSRTGLASLTGLTRPAVSALIAELQRLGLVSDVGVASAPKTGRPASLLEIDGSQYAGITIELNAGYVKTVVRDLGMRETYRELRTLSVGLSPEGALDFIRDRIDQAKRVSSSEGRTVVGTVLGLPAIVDSRTGLVVSSPALGWTDVRVRDALGLDPDELLIDNLANLAAMGETHLPEHRDSGHLIHLEVGAGVGAGTVIGDQVMHGGGGFAGAIGHIPLDPKGPACRCGRRGCFEAIVNIDALFARTIPDLVGEPPTGYDPRLVRDVAERARSGDPIALAGIDETATWLGLGAAVLINMLSPQVLVLGGYVPALSEWLLEPTIATLKRQVVAEPLGGISIVPSELGDQAAEYGAAAVLRDKAFTADGLSALTDSVRLTAAGS